MKTLRHWFSSLTTQYHRELAAETGKYNILPAHHSERNITDLPPLIQQHLNNCGYARSEPVICCQMTWKNAELKFKPKGKWTPLECTQVNFVPQPARLVLMKARRGTWLNFCARDKYQDEKGSMLIRLFDKILISEDTGPKMDQAELVTILAETMVVPLYALQHYISWQTIDAHTVKGTIRDGNTVASGLFQFDERGLMHSFKTKDRFYTINGECRSVPWTASAERYICRGDVMFPSVFKATWHLPGDDHNYFRGEITRLEYNVLP